MKSYDDLQRFKEKTQTHDIKFKDMSEQTGESDTASWAIIKQLSRNDKSDLVLDQGQSIDLIQPQPVDKHAFSAPASASAVSGKSAFFVAPPATAPASGSLLDSIAAELRSAPAAGPQMAPAAPQSTPEPTDGVISTLPFSASERPAPAAFPPPAPLAAKRPEPPPRYSSLFSSPGTATHAVITKDALLKPLLEKIALCR